MSLAALWRSSGFRLPAILIAVPLGLLGLFPSRAAAQGSWFQQGPDAGRVRVVVDPLTRSTVYAATEGGVFRSLNGGASWTPVNNGLTTLRVTALAIDPITPSILYAGTVGKGVFRSVDRGQSWSAINTGLNSSHIQVLVVNPVDPTIVYAGTSDVGISRTTNSGGQWTPISAGLYIPDLPEIRAIAIDPQTPTTVYAGTGPTANVFRSLNGGNTWTLVDSGLPNLPYSDVTALAIDPLVPTTLYAGTGNSGVFRSTNSGNNWSAINTGLTMLGVDALAIDPQTPTSLYVGIFEAGVFRTTNSGDLWSIANNGLTDLIINGFAIHPLDPQILYIGTLGGGVFLSPDGGTTWRPVNRNLTALRVTALVVDPNSPLTVYAGTSSAFLASSTGVFRSLDGGTTWAEVSAGLPRSPFRGIVTLAIDPLTSTTLYATTEYGGVWRTTNSGDHWSSIGTGLPSSRVNALVVDPVSPSTLYAGVRSSGVYRSSNSGMTWSPANAGILASNLIRDLVIDPSDPSILYACLDGGGIYRTTNGAASWTEVNPLWASRLAIDPHTPSILYAATSPSGLFKSTDSGSTWQPASAGLPVSVHTSVVSIAIDPETPSTIYAGTFTPSGSFGSTVPPPAGVFRSTDGGATWNSFNVGLPSLVNVNALAIDPAAPATLYAGTDERSVFRFRTGAVPNSDVVENGGFASGLSGWLTFSTPDPSYINVTTVGGVLQFFRLPPPIGVANQAVVFQQTNLTVGSDSALLAQFELGNSSSVRKRISVLVHDIDFSDLSVCTFWLAPGAPLANYQMITHTTEDWTRATISFYAATAGSDGGAYLVDNVSLQYAPGQPSTETTCVDPTAPDPPGGADSANLLTNGSFGTGLLAPWGLFGTIVSQIASGIFEFYRPAGDPAGVVLQQTGASVVQSEVLTATFDLGNSSSVRKRVTVLLHDADFSDLVACTFWLPPGASLSTYQLRTFATEAWPNATLSVYPSTVGPERWFQLDDATLQRTPAATPVGTECLEPGSSSAPSVPTSSRAASRAVGAGRSVVSSGDSAGSRSFSWQAEPAGLRLDVSSWPKVLDLRGVTEAALSFDSRMSIQSSQAEAQVSLDGVTWQVVAIVPASEAWTPIQVDLSAFAGRLIGVRLVLTAVDPRASQPTDAWFVRGVAVHGLVAGRPRVP